MSDPATILRELQPLFQSLARAKVVYYMHVAATCAFMYDHLTTLSDEVNIVWPAPWTVGKVCFLIERYLTWPELIFTIYMELADLEAHVCHVFFACIAWSVTFAIVVTDLILALRTWALWGGRRSVLVSLAILLVLVAAGDSIIVVPYIRQTSFVRASDIIPSLNGCVIAQSTRRIAFGWMILTFFELVIVILTVIKGIEQFRLGRASNLITSLYRDGILYFIYLFALSLGNMLTIFTAPSEYIVLFVVAQRAFNAILTCKIILHLQAAAVGHGDVSGRALLSTMPMFTITETTRVAVPRGAKVGQSYASEWFGPSPSSRV